MEKVVRWGIFAMGIVLITHGTALIFMSDGLLHMSRGSALYFKAVSGLFGYSIAQTLAVMVSISVGVASVYVALAWGRKQEEKK